MTPCASCLGDEAEPPPCAAFWQNQCRSSLHPSQPSDCPLQLTAWHRPRVPESPRAWCGSCRTRHDLIFRWRCFCINFSLETNRIGETWESLCCINGPSQAPWRVSQPSLAFLCPSPGPLPRILPSSIPAHLPGIATPGALSILLASGLPSLVPLPWPPYHVPKYCVSLRWLNTFRGAHCWSTSPDSSAWASWLCRE